MPAKAKEEKKAEPKVAKIKTQEDLDKELLAKSAVGGEGGEGKLSSVEYTEERMPGKVE